MLRLQAIDNARYRVILSNNERAKFSTVNQTLFDYVLVAQDNIRGRENALRFLFQLPTVPAIEEGKRVSSCSALRRVTASKHNHPGLEIVRGGSV